MASETWSQILSRVSLRSTRKANFGQLHVPGWPSPTDSEVKRKCPGARAAWIGPLGAIFLLVKSLSLYEKEGQREERTMVQKVDASIKKSLISLRHQDDSITPFSPMLFRLFRHPYLGCANLPRL